MYMLGSHPIDAREMLLDDILQRRIKLLLVMAKRYLEGAPLGRTQRTAMIRNVDFVETECDSLPAFGNAGRAEHPGCLDDSLCQQLKQLAIMIRSVAMGLPMNPARRQSMLLYAKNVHRLLAQAEPWHYCYLKVA